MDGSAPVFRDRDSIRQWKRLNSAERSLINGRDSKHTKMTIAVNDILGRTEHLDPRIACKVLDIIERYSIGDVRSMVLLTMEKCELTDSSPQIKASDILMKMGLPDMASSILDRMTLRNDVTSWEYVRGTICLQQGDVQSAYQHFLQCYKNDDTFIPVYALLHQCEPDGGWKSREMIARLFSGGSVPADNSAPSDPMEDLVSYYRQWAAGNRDVLRTLQSSQAYIDGNEDYILAAARFEHSFDDLRSSVTDYRRLEAVSYSASLELVRVLMDAGELDAAEALCRDLSVRNTGDRRFNEILLELYVTMGNSAALLTAVRKYLSYDYADADAYSLAAESLMSLSLYSDAALIIDDMSESGVPEAYYLSAKNDHLTGRQPHALRSVDKALKESPTDPDYRILKVGILLSMGKTAKAVANLELVLKDHPRHLEALRMKRDILYDKEDLEGAYGICETMRTVVPNDPDLLRYMGMLLKRMDRPEDALKLYKDAIGIREDPDLFINVITSLVKEGRYKDAASVISEYDDVYGNMRDTWILKGNAEYACGRYPEACESYEKALDMDRNDPILWHSKGMAAEAMGDYATASDAYDHAVLLDLSNPDYWISRSVVEERSGDLSAAVESLNRVISDYPDNTYALLRKAHILHSLGRYRDASVFIDLASKVEPGNYEIMRMKRDILIRIPDTKRAREVASRMVHMRPDDTQGRLEYARMCIADKDYDEALRVLSKGPGHDIDILRLMLSIHRLANDTEAVISICGRILKIDPDDTDAMMAMADAYTELGDNTKASELYDRLKTIHPESTEVQIKQARVSSEADRESLLETLKENIASDPENTDAMLDLADILIDMRRYEDAESYIDMAIAASPASSEPYLKKAGLLMDLGLYEDALDTLEEAKSSSIIQDARIWEMIGDANASMGDNEKALLSYDSALKMDLSLIGINTKIGKIQEGAGQIDDSMDNYMKAYEKDHTDIEAMYRMARILFSEGRLRTSERYIDEILAIDPAYGPAVLIKAKILSKSDDIEGLRSLLEGAVKDGIDREYVDEMEFILSESEIGADVTDDADDDNIEDLALTLLKYSYDNDVPYDDPESIRAAGIADTDVGKVMVFLSDIDRCRDIVPVGEWFYRMEELSCNVVTSGKVDLERDRMLPLQMAMFASGASDIKEAKGIASYFYTAMTVNVDPFEFDQSITDAVDTLTSEGAVPDLSTIVRRFNVGIYSARTILLLLENGQ